MNFEQKPLPYAFDALEPHLSAQTLETHYAKHHAGYLKKLMDDIEGTNLDSLELEAIVRLTSQDPKASRVFHNAAQVFNHDFYWASMRPAGGGVPKDPSLEMAIKAAFGGLDEFRAKFVDTADSLFGSGYVWLLADPAEPGGIALAPMKDADNPIVTGRVPLLACDVWEHAYYLDHRYERRRYAALFFDHLVDWAHAARQLGVAPLSHQERKRA